RGSACLSLEAAGVLRQRLGVAALIAFFPNLFFLTLALADPPSAPRWLGFSGMLSELVVCVICGGLAALLWSSTPLSPCTLRRLELLLFGTVAIFFVWLHFSALATLNDLLRLSPSASPEENRQLLIIFYMAGALRWFFLIVLYGVFIPNS